MINTVGGVAGRLVWGYHRAATLGAWILTRLEDGSGWALTATVQTADTFRLAQQPLVFEATHQHGRWRWPVQVLQITGASLTATLGPKES